MAANSSAHRSFGQWRHPLSGGGSGEADAVAGGEHDMGVVQQPVDGGVGDGPPALHRSFLQAGWDKSRDNVAPGVIMTFVAGLALFSFTNLKSDIHRIEDNVSARFSEFKGEIATDFAAVDARFAKLEDGIDARFAAVDARFTKLEENQQEIAVTMARIDSRLDAVVALLEAGGDGER